VFVRASGLPTRFQDPATVLCLNIAEIVLTCLESLNRALQSTRMTLARMLEAAKPVKSHLQELRKDSTFNELLTKAEHDIKRCGLKPLQLLRVRKPLARFNGLAEAFKNSHCKHALQDRILNIDRRCNSAARLPAVELYRINPIVRT